MRHVCNYMFFCTEQSESLSNSRQQMLTIAVHEKTPRMGLRSAPFCRRWKMIVSGKQR